MLLQLRALILITLGIPALTALLMGAGVLTVRLWGEVAFDRGYWLGLATFGGLSAVALAIVLVAHRRSVAAPAPGMLARVARGAPFLMLIGAIGGAVIAHFMAEDVIGNHRSFVERACRDLLGPRAPIDACRPVMDRCFAEVSGTGGIPVDRRGQLTIDWPQGLAVPSSARDRALHLCAWKALHAVR